MENIRHRSLRNISGPGRCLCLLGFRRQGSPFQYLNRLTKKHDFLYFILFGTGRRFLLAAVFFYIIQPLFHLTRTGAARFGLIALLTQILGNVGFIGIVIDDNTRFDTGLGQHQNGQCKDYYAFKTIHSAKVCLKGVMSKHRKVNSRLRHRHTAKSLYIIESKCQVVGVLFVEQIGYACAYFQVLE